MATRKKTTKKKTTKRVATGTKKRKKTPPKPGTPAAIAGWKPFNKEFPEVLVGKDPDGWFGVVVGRDGYIAYERKSDRDGLAKDLIACIQKHVKEAEATAGEFEEQLADANSEIEKLKKVLAATQKQLGRTKQVKKKTSKRAA